MNGNFNGIDLRKITAFIESEDPSGWRRICFRVAEPYLPKLEQVLRLRSQVVMILADREIEGRLVHYFDRRASRYEITIEAKKTG